MVPPVARVRSLVVMPAAEAPELLGPVLTAHDLRRIVRAVSHHGAIISLWHIGDSVLLR